MAISDPKRQQAARLLAREVAALDRAFDDEAAEEAASIYAMTDAELDAALHADALPMEPGLPAELAVPVASTSHMEPVRRRPPQRAAGRPARRGGRPRFRRWTPLALAAGVLLATLAVFALLQRGPGGIDYLGLEPVAAELDGVEETLRTALDEEASRSFAEALTLYEEAEEGGDAQTEALLDASERLEILYTALERQGGVGASSTQPSVDEDRGHAQGVIALLLGQAALAQGERVEARRWLQAAQIYGAEPVQRRAEALLGELDNG